MNSISIYSIDLTQCVFVVYLFVFKIDRFEILYMRGSSTFAMDSTTGIEYFLYLITEEIRERRKLECQKTVSCRAKVFGIFVKYYRHVGRLRMNQ